MRCGSILHKKQSQGISQGKRLFFHSQGNFSLFEAFLDNFLTVQNTEYVTYIYILQQVLHILLGILQTIMIKLLLKTRKRSFIFQMFALNILLHTRVIKAAYKSIIIHRYNQFKASENQSKQQIVNWRRHRYSSEEDNKQENYFSDYTHSSPEDLDKHNLQLSSPLPQSIESVKGAQRILF